MTGSQVSTGNRRSPKLNRLFRPDAKALFREVVASHGVTMGRTLIVPGADGAAPDLGNRVKVMMVGSQPKSGRYLAK